MYTILVQMGEEKWTMEAMHLACALARSAWGSGARVALLRLMEVQQLSYLGTSFGEVPPDEAEFRRLKEYNATAEDYGVVFAVHSMQCVSRLDAVVQAADELDAVVVFARVGPSRFAFWQRFQVWNLQRRFRRKQCQLFTLDQPVGSLEWMPSITVRAVVPRQPQPGLPPQPVQDQQP
jgi:hypothetical protein